MAENNIDELIRAADAGNAKAQTHLGWCYDEGIGVETDRKTAAQLYRNAALKGYSIGQYNLALCYDHGTGVRKNMALAVKWYKKSAELGYPKARKVLKKLESGK